MVLPSRLSVRTDILGNPIYRNFDVKLYSERYWLLAVAFPLLALAFFLVLARGRRPAAAPDAAAPIPATCASPALRSALRLAFVGGVVGAAAAVAAGAGRYTGWIGAAAAVDYVGFALLAAACARRARVPFVDRVAAVNALFAVVGVVAAVWLVSRSTSVQAGERLVRFDWFSAPVAATLASVLVAAVAAALRRTRAPSVVEGAVVAYLVGSVALLLALASFPGAIGPMDPFHEGEWLAAAHLTQQGAVPWRDLLTVHGVLPDVLLPLVAFHLFGDTRWAYLAARFLLFDPLFIASLYVLTAYLCRRHRVLLFLAWTGLVLGSMPLLWAVHDRFFLYPFELLLLAWLLRRPRPWLAVVYAAVVCVHAVITPESVESAFAMLAMLVAFEVYHRDGRPLRLALRRTVWSLGTAAVFVAVLVSVLVAHHALGSYVFYYRTFGTNYALATGIPVAWHNPTGVHMVIAVVVPVVLWLATFALFAWKLWARRPIDVDEWIAGAMALLLLVYYPKFLGRADGHVYQVFALSIPLLVWWALRGLVAGERLLARLRLPARLEPRLAAVAVLVAVAAAAPQTPWAALSALPGKFRGTAPSAVPPFPRLGFANDTDVDLPALHDLRALIDDYAGRTGAVADLTNSPAIFYYLLDRKPGSRYYHVSMAFKRRNQRDLIGELRRSRPPLVVYSYTGAGGLATWDGIPSQLRAYDVAEWVLRHYRPIAATHGYLVFARPDRADRPLPGGLDGQPVTTGLYFETQPCDWGYAPNFLSTRPADPRAPLTLPVADAAEADVSGWAIGAGGGPAERVVFARGPRVVASVVPSLTRSDVAASLHDARAARAGFQADVPGEGALRAYAVTGKTAWELDAAPSLPHAKAVPPQQLVLGNGSALRVSREPGHGFVESVTQGRYAATVTLPPNASSYSWLEVVGRGKLGAARISLDDGSSAPSHTIALTTLERAGRTVRIQVGACAQWYGYGRRVTLAADRPLALRAVRLYH